MSASGKFHSLRMTEVHSEAVELSVIRVPSGHEHLQETTVKQRAGFGQSFSGRTEDLDMMSMCTLWGFSSGFPYRPLTQDLSGFSSHNTKSFH